MVKQDVYVIRNLHKLLLSRPDIEKLHVLAIIGSVEQLGQSVIDKLSHYFTGLGNRRKSTPFNWKKGLSLSHSQLLEECLYHFWNQLKKSWIECFDWWWFPKSMSQQSGLLAWYQFEKNWIVCICVDLTPCNKGASPVASSMANTHTTNGSWSLLEVRCQLWVLADHRRMQNLISSQAFGCDRIGVAGIGKRIIEVW